MYVVQNDSHLSIFLKFSFQVCNNSYMISHSEIECIVHLN